MSGERVGLAEALRERTRALHVEAERSGFVAEMLRGRASRAGYALFLRNLLPAYRALEQGLERHRLSPGVRAVARPALYRAPALEADLERLCGPAWRDSLPLLPAGEHYARQVAAVGEGEPARLVAHAYVRYLGDLNGGQILHRLLARTLDPTALSFHDFPDITDLVRFRAEYRQAFDRAGLELADAETVVDEAVQAFRLNIELSAAVLEAIRPEPAL